MEKHSLTIAGHRTSVSLEPVFWRAVSEIARQRGQTTAALITRIDAERDGNLSSALRVFVIEYYRAELGLDRATSGPGCHIAPQSAQIPDD